MTAFMTQLTSLLLSQWRFVTAEFDTVSSILAVQTTLCTWNWATRSVWCIRDIHTPSSSTGLCFICGLICRVLVSVLSKVSKCDRFPWSALVLVILQHRSWFHKERFGLAPWYLSEGPLGHLTLVSCLVAVKTRAFRSGGLCWGCDDLVLKARSKSTDTCCSSGRGLTGAVVSLGWTSGSHSPFSFLHILTGILQWWNYRDIEYLACSFVAFCSTSLNTIVRNKYM